MSSGRSDAVQEPLGSGVAQVPLVAPSPSPSRERDWLWEAVLRECGIDPGVVTDSARGAYNRAVKSIRDVGGTPNDVRARGLAYRKAFPSARLTPPALARHWAELAPVREDVLVPNQVRRCPQCQKLTFDCVCA